MLRLLVEFLRELSEKPCAAPDPNVIAAYVEGGLLKVERRRFEEHLADCRLCRQAAVFASVPPRTSSG